MTQNRVLLKFNPHEFKSTQQNHPRKFQFLTEKFSDLREKVRRIDVLNYVKNKNLRN